MPNVNLGDKNDLRDSSNLMGDLERLGLISVSNLC